jgi:uncharacterized membrane protein
MAERDTILAVLQSDISFAGLVLVFVGFLLSKADSYETKSGDKYRYLAVAGFIPVLSALASAWFCAEAIEGNGWWASHALLSLEIVLVLTAVYILTAGVTFLPPR